VQRELLSKYSSPNLRVYAVWFNMYPGDARSKWPASLLTDGRVIHRWDEGKVVGRWYGARTDSMRARLTPESAWEGEILWDSYQLYGADSVWTDEPTGLIHWGRTIVAGRQTLGADFEELFTPGPQPRDAAFFAPPWTIHVSAPLR
jgi:hypothetical protein